MPETQRNPFIAAGSIAVVIAAAVGTAVLFVREQRLFFSKPETGYRCSQL